MKYLVLPPDRNVLAGRTVTSTVGTPDTDHPLSWLTDLRPAFPIRYPAGAWGVSISVATQDIQLVVLANHSIDANVTVGGAVGTISPPTLPPNSVPRNPYLYLTSPTVGVTALTLNGTNIADMVLGEAFAGVPIELEPLQMADYKESFEDGSDDSLGGEWLNIPGHDYGEEWRPFSGSQVYHTTDRDKIIAWWEAQRAASQPSVIIKDSSVNDARVVMMKKPSWTKGDHKDLWKITLEFIEYPRYRW